MSQYLSIPGRLTPFDSSIFKNIDVYINNVFIYLCHTNFNDMYNYGSTVPEQISFFQF